MDRVWVVDARHASIPMLAHTRTHHTARHDRRRDGHQHARRHQHGARRDAPRAVRMCVCVSLFLSTNNASTNCNRSIERLNSWLTD
jgi:hypothetical protein